MWQAFRYTRPTLNGLEPLAHVRQLVVDRVAYFPRPSQLNDHQDCRPRMVRPSQAQIVAYLARQGAARHPGRSLRTQRRRARIYAEHRLANSHTLKLLWAGQAERFGILSLSRSACNYHLWTKYAEQSRGLCIQFSMEPIINHGITAWIPFAVEYRAEQPALNILDYQSPAQELVEQFVDRSFRIKLVDWMPEEEIRVVRQLKHGAQEAPVPPGVLRAVYLGPQMAAVHRQEILSWGIELPIFEAIADERGGVIAFRHIAGRAP